jgi:hypothetical protein
MTRLGVALGAKQDTFMGLAGMGDLVLTCTDDQSRNRRMGLMLATGKTIEEAQAEIQQVVEGVLAAKAVKQVEDVGRNADLPADIRRSLRRCASARGRNGPDEQGIEARVGLKELLKTVNFDASARKRRAQNRSVYAIQGADDAIAQKRQFFEVPFSRRRRIRPAARPRKSRPPRHSTG